MKKIMMLFSVMLISLAVTAADIKVVSGKASFMKREGSAVVLFNWDDAKYDNKESMKDYWKDDYDQYISEGKKKFIEGFNKSSKKVKLGDSDDAGYTFTVAVANIDYFFSVMSFIPGHKHTIWCTITITEKATGNEICKINVDEFKGGRDFSKFDSFTEMMHDLGKYIGKMK